MTKYYVFTEMKLNINVKYTDFSMTLIGRIQYIP